MVTRVPCQQPTSGISLKKQITFELRFEGVYRVGHVEWMKGERLPIAALHGHVEGKRGRGGKGRFGWTMLGKT